LLTSPKSSFIGLGNLSDSRLLRNGTDYCSDWIINSLC